MDDRFTERARRVIFFARYEAGLLGSESADTEHFLLGLVREDKILSERLQNGGGPAIRRRIEGKLPNPRRRISPFIDMPFTEDVERAVSNAAGEARNLSHNSIDSGHLILGLLRIDNCTASTLLREQGIEYENYTAVAAGTPAPQPAASTVLESIVGLQWLLQVTLESISRDSVAYAQKRLKRKPWTRQEAFGHLVDWALMHKQWLARALTESSLVAPGYPPDLWVSTQEYRFYSWTEIVNLWVSVNRFLVHVLVQIPDDKANLICRIGIDQPIPLSRLVERYVRHCEDVAGQIAARL